MYLTDDFIEKFERLTLPNHEAMLQSLRHMHQLEQEMLQGWNDIILLWIKNLTECAQVS